MADLWGFAGGFSAGQADSQSAQLFQQQMQAAPLQRQALELSNQEQGVKLEQAQLQLAQLKKFNELMSQAKPPGQSSQAPADQLSSMVEQQASQLDQFGEMAMQAGMPEQAKEYLSTASQLRTNAADVAGKQQTQAMKNLELIGRLLPTVHDQKSWDQAQAMFTLETGHASPFQGSQWSPELGEKLKAAYESDKDKATIATDQARVKASEAEAAERTARLKLIAAQTQLADKRIDHLAKQGVDVKPKAEDLKAASDLVLHDYPDLANASGEASSEARMYARPIADRMVELMTREGLPRAEAAQQAYKEFEASGHFEGLTKGSSEAGTEKNPMPVPMSGKGVDVSKLKPNKYYTNSAGRVALWTGTAFQTPKKTVDTRALGDDDDTEPNPDEDDEKDEEGDDK